MDLSKPDSILTAGWLEIRQLLWADNCIVSPNKFIELIQKVAAAKHNDAFSTYGMQNDITEFFLFLIDCFHNSIAKTVKLRINGVPNTKQDKIAIKCYSFYNQMFSSNYSEIITIFYGIGVTTITSIDTGIIHYIIPDIFSILSLPIQGEDLMDCFNAYCNKETMDGDNSVFIEATGQKEAVYKKIAFWDLPKVLVIDLKRYGNNGGKNKSFVRFPLENMDLSGYVCSYNKKKYIYDLYAVCHHAGKTQGGHYYAYIKTYNGLWYLFNDNVVVSIPNEEIEKQLITPSAYCLFYRRRRGDDV
jgi:ubiquitin C-terminal hydrolase